MLLMVDNQQDKWHFVDVDNNGCIYYSESGSDVHVISSSAYSLCVIQ